MYSSFGFLTFLQVSKSGFWLQCAFLMMHLSGNSKFSDLPDQKECKISSNRSDCCQKGASIGRFSLLLPFLLISSHCCFIEGCQPSVALYWLGTLQMPALPVDKQCLWTHTHRSINIPEVSAVVIWIRWSLLSSGGHRGIVHKHPRGRIQHQLPLCDFQLPPKVKWPHSHPKINSYGHFYNLLLRGLYRHSCVYTCWWQKTGCVAVVSNSHCLFYKMVSIKVNGL